MLGKYAVKRDRSGRVESYLLAPYLAQFNWCFQHGTAPDDWGLALLAMIHNGGNRQLTGVITGPLL
jgi:hypothetical protein